MPIRITGMNSGLDTESIVSALVSGTKAKKDKLVKAQTKQQWKMDAWKGVNTKVYDLYKSLDKMRLSTGGYKTKKTTVSDATKASVTASGSATNGTQTLSVNKLASAGYLTGGKLAEGTTGQSKLSSLTYKDTANADQQTNFSGSGRITVNTANGSKDIELNATDSMDDIVSKLKDAGVNASYDSGNGRLFISAKESGKDNDFSITASDANGVNALNALKINVQSTANTSAYNGYAKYALNSEGNAYYTFNDDGTVTTNGDYDEGRTQANISQILNNLQTSHQTVADKTTENASLNRKIAYANAQSENTAAMSGVPENVKNNINTLISSTAAYAHIDDGGVLHEYTERTDNGNGTYTYKTADGTEVTDTQDYGSAADVLEGLAKDTFRKNLKGEGGETLYEEDGVTPKTEYDADAWNKYKANYNTVTSFETAAVGDTDAENFMTRVSAAINGNGNESVSDITEELGAAVTTNTRDIADANAYISSNSAWDVPGIADMTSGQIADEVTNAMSKIALANQALSGGMTYSDDANDPNAARRVNGTDAQITLNGATFESSSNKFSINGLTINATATTAPGESITITTASDTQATYDKIKDFLTQYNEVMNSLSSSYNAEAAKGYEPLTDEEKEQMSDTEIEKWETKVKDSLLRRDSTLSSIMSTISGSMSKAYSVTMADGSTKNLSLASLGIKTGGYLATSAANRYAYHIDGDEEDDVSSGYSDKLKKMIEEDPDAVESLMKQVTQGLYDSLDAKMKSTSMSSAYTIYNDKEMAKEHSSYTTQIKTWETKLSDMEDRYYKQFAAMEKALATLNSNSSSLSSMLGG